jgi:hypothetical protein
MIRNLKAALLVGGIVLAAGAMGTAAFSTVSFDRNLSVSLAADDASNAAIKIACAADYQVLDVCSTDTNGKITVNLNRALGGGTAVGLNRHAAFQIGGIDHEVVAITNSTDSTVTVYFASGEGITLKNESGTALTDVGAVPATGQAIGPGFTKSFFFTVLTPDSTATSLSGTLKIR